jgi:ABC-type protease/lipase transport system fused ATPase/permease subunit
LEEDLGDDDNDDEFTGDSAAELSWKDLQVTSPDGKKVLLHEACGRVKGRFLAIMGPSGAGKVHHHRVVVFILSFSWFLPPEQPATRRT